LNQPTNQQKNLRSNIHFRGRFATLDLRYGRGFLFLQSRSRSETWVDARLAGVDGGEVGDGVNFFLAFCWRDNDGGFNGGVGFGWCWFDG
jgi:hypothetical protein